MNSKRISQPTEKAQAQLELQKGRQKRGANDIDDTTQNKRAREDTDSRGGQSSPDHTINIFDAETTTSITNLTESGAESSDTDKGGQDKNSDTELGAKNLW